MSLFKGHIWLRHLGPKSNFIGVWKTLCCSTQSFFCVILKNCNFSEADYSVHTELKKKTHIDIEVNNLVSYFSKCLFFFIYLSQFVTPKIVWRVYFYFNTFQLLNNLKNEWVEIIKKCKTNLKCCSRYQT